MAAVVPAKVSRDLYSVVYISDNSYRLIITNLARVLVTVFV